MKPDPHSQGRAAVWRTEIDGMPHTVELEIGYTTGAWQVWLDGRLLTNPAEGIKAVYAFTVGKRECVIRARGSRFTLHVDGWRIPLWDPLGDQLLRPASAPESLLRPAGSIKSVDDHLLRPADDSPS